MPVQSAGSRPGPTVTVTKSIFFHIFIAFLSLPKIWRHKRGSAFKCSRFAIFGTTPPNGRWMEICDETVFAKTSNFGARMPPVALRSAMPVSSQLVSMPRTIMASAYQKHRRDAKITHPMLYNQNMRFLLVVLTIVFVIFLVAIVAARVMTSFSIGNIVLPNGNNVPPSPPPRGNTIVATTTATGGPISTSSNPGFHGPTSPPHVIGPTTPPPSY